MKYRKIIEGEKTWLIEVNPYQTPRETEANLLPPSENARYIDFEQQAIANKRLLIGDFPKDKEAFEESELEELHHWYDGYYNCAGNRILFQEALSKIPKQYISLLKVSHKIHFHYIGKFEETPARKYAKEFWKGYEGCATISFDRGSEYKEQQIMDMIDEEIAALTSYQQKSEIHEKLVSIKQIKDKLEQIKQKIRP